MSKRLKIDLGLGVLHLELLSGTVPVSRLLGFATRIGSKRQFLLVSKILGKHYPASPRIMAWSYRALARMVIKSEVNGSSLWIGMAETATGLGYGVFAAAYAEGLRGALFMQTSRYLLSGSQYLEFQETHSHATDLFLYYPTPQQSQHFLSAQTLVLIDDEISTGSTFLRLIQAYQQVNPKLSKVMVVSLVNFASTADRELVERQAGVTLEWLCFRQGQLHFESIQHKTFEPAPVNVVGNGQCKRHLLGWPGRLGLSQPIQLPADTVIRLMGYFKMQVFTKPLLVLGTGECNAPAFLMAWMLEQHGIKTKVQSTTRSPIRQGLAIQSVQQFEDNYHDGIANFIYNLEVDAYHGIVVCHETPRCNALDHLLTQWQAVGAQIHCFEGSSDASVHFYRLG